MCVSVCGSNPIRTAPRHSTPRHATPCHATPHYAIPHYSNPIHAESRIPHHASLKRPRDVNSNTYQANGIK